MAEGFFEVKPKIKKVSFEKRGKISVALEDGRVVIMPLSSFPSIKKIPLVERKKYYIAGGAITWKNRDAFVSLEDILGDFNKYNHEAD